MSKAMLDKDLLVVHTVDGFWKMKHYPIEVTHARQRPLSLLELHILKAFNDIKQCKTDDIVNQLGLDVRLVESTLRVLKLCRVIDSVYQNDNFSKIIDQRRQLESQKKSILERLEHTGRKDEQRRELSNKLNIIHEQLNQISSLNSLEEDVYVVNNNGKKALRELHIKEPVETKIYSFLRCMTTGKLMILGRQGLPKNSIDESWTREAAIDQKEWENPVVDMYQTQEPNQAEVEKALSDFYPNDDIEINSIELMAELYENGEVNVPIHLSLAISSGGIEPQVVVNLHRNELTRLDWMMETASKGKVLDSIISFVSTCLPRPMGSKSDLASAIPMARLDYAISNEVGNDGIIISKNFEQLREKYGFNLTNVDRLLSSRTTVCVDAKMENKYTIRRQTNDLPLSIVMPDTLGMNENSFSTSSGSVGPGKISIKNSAGKEVSLPVLDFSAQKGKEYNIKVDRYLRNVLSAEDLFAFSGLELDLNRWVRNGTRKLKFDSVKSLLQEFDNFQAKVFYAVDSKGINHLSLCLNELLKVHGEKIFTHSSGLETLIEIVTNSRSSETEKSKSWNLIQHELHKHVITTVTKEDNEAELYRLWFEIRERKSQLVWEEMALLEFALSSNTTFTFNEVNRHIERFVTDLIVGNNLTTGTLAEMIDSLESAGIITKEMRKEMDKNKSWRNIITHEYDFDASLENTNLSIKVLRILSEINPPKNDKRFDKVNLLRDFSWNFTSQQLDDYVDFIHKLASSLRDSFTLDTNIWIQSIMDRLPINYQEVPSNTLKKLDSLMDGKQKMNTSSIKSRMINDCVSKIVSSSSKPGSYEIPEDVLELLDLMIESNLVRESKNIAQQYLSEVPYATSASKLFNEVLRSRSFDRFIPRDKNIIRWKRTIEGKNFSVDYEQLKEGIPETIEILGKSNSKELVKIILSDKLKTGTSENKLTDNIVELCDFVKENEQWLKNINELENYVFERVKILMKKNDLYADWLEQITTSSLKNSKLQKLQQNLLREKARIQKKGGKK